MNTPRNRRPLSLARFRDGRELTAGLLLAAGFAALVAVNFALLARLLPAAA